METKDIWVDEDWNIFHEPVDNTEGLTKYFHEDDAICRGCYNDLKDGLTRIAAAAGNPDPAEACRIILAIVKEIS